MEITETIRCTLGEIAECHDQYESMYDMFTAKVAEKIDKDLCHFQIVCYNLVGVDAEKNEVLIEVEGYEE